jgi:hypothetical protein
MAPKRASQQKLKVDQFKLLKKPMEHLGKQINVPGSFWKGRMLPDERDKVYRCTIVDFSLAHKFAPDSSPRKAFKMQEMGIDGTGSHEKSDLASTMYWIDYPLPFLRFYYNTFPGVDDDLAGAAEVASLARAGGNGVNGSASDGCASSATVTHTDVHPEFPSLRIPSAVIYRFFRVISDKLIEMGPTSGKFAALWECTVLDEGGQACCNRRRINHERDKTCQTSNLIAHLRERSANCKFHQTAMKQVDIGSKNCVEVDGDMVKIHNFSEAQTSWVTRHKNPAPLLYQVSGLVHDLLTARLLLYIGVSRGIFAKFRPETDAFIEISNLTQSLPHNQTPTSKFQVPSTRVLLIDMSRWIPSTHTHE